jgi:uncharacterized protein DUF885
MNRLLLVAMFAAIQVAGAQTTSSSSRFPALANEFVFTTLSFSPSGATQQGLHRYTDPITGRVMLLDQMLDDFSPASLARQRAFYEDFKRRLQKIPRASLDPQTRVDYSILQNAIGSALFTLNDEQFLLWKPEVYSENLGSALFANISLEYADKNTRAADLAARVDKVPGFIDQAIQNLSASNDVFRRVAIESIDGVRDLVKGMGADFVKGTPSESRYARAQPGALAALDKYTAFVNDELPKKPQRDWRMGKKLFDKKFGYYLEVSGAPDDLLRAAEDSMRTTRLEMLKLSEPLHKQWFPSHSHPSRGSDEYTNTVVGEVMTRIGAEHVNRDSLVREGEIDVAMLEKFVVDHRILSLADFSNLRVIVTPLFMRGIYGVAGAVFAPALEPNLATFYWVTPIPSSWTKEQADSKMREYNKYKFLTISIHEAVPGHAVQGEYANRVTPEWRRLLRVIYGNNPYIEGWAVYTEHMMEAAGVNAGDPVKMHLTALKGMLRIYMNTIIDVRLHTKNLPGDSAVAMMMREAFQERPEAVAKLQRAQLDYVQLMTYMAGVEEWTNLRRDVQKKEGSRFSQCRYHDRVLLYGPVPVPTVRKLYMAGVAPTAKAPPSRCE